jgi:hypothetical protein
MHDPGISTAEARASGTTRNIACAAETSHRRERTVRAGENRFSVRRLTAMQRFRIRTLNRVCGHV